MSLTAPAQQHRKAPKVLTTRPPTPDDAPALAALMTPSISQWLGHWPVPFTSAMAEAKISDALSAAAHGAALTEVILNDGVIAGWIGGSGPPGRTGFGYWLGEAHQGRGLLRNLAPAWVAHLHARLHPRTVWAATQPINVGSRRVLAACGLQPVRLTWMDTPARARFEWVEVWERVWPPSATQ